MGEQVVLPKFELPGDKPHWAVRTGRIVGGLLVLSVLGLGGVIVHHRNQETQAKLAREEAIARVKAEAEAKVAAVAAAAKARKEAELAAKAAAAKMAAQTMPATTLPGSVGTESETAKASGKPVHARHAHGSHASRDGRLVASRPGMKSGTKTDGRPASHKPDPIDELLKKMK